MTEAAEVSLQNGAIVMVDALGFKGIWQRYDPIDVVREMQRLCDSAFAQMSELEREARKQEGNFIEYCRPAFLSDTVVLGVVTKPAERVRKGMQNAGWGEIGQELNDDDMAAEAVRIAAFLVSKFIRESLRGPIPLAYRGAIAFGQFCMTERFIIGEAVDEAVELMNSTEGALIVGGPSVDSMQFTGVPTSEYPMWRAPVAWKTSQQPKETWMVCPFAGTDDAAHEDLMAKLRSTFPDNPSGDVALKLEKTIDFCTQARRAERAPYEELLKAAMNPFGAGD